jgi:hypothetical protein
MVLGGEHREHSCNGQPDQRDPDREPRVEPEGAGARSTGDPRFARPVAWVLLTEASLEVSYDKVQDSMVASGEAGRGSYPHPRCARRRTTIIEA